MVDLDNLFVSIKEIDNILLELLNVKPDKLTDRDLLLIQSNIEKRDGFLRQINHEMCVNLNEEQDKEWQALAHRTQKLVKLATYKKDNIKDSIDKREQGKRSIAAYKQLLY